MRFIRIGDAYAVHVDRILDVSYTDAACGELRDGVWSDGTPARVTVRLAGAAGVEERTLEGYAAETFWSNLVGFVPR